MDVGGRVTWRAGRFAEPLATRTRHAVFPAFCAGAGRSAAPAVTASIGHGGQ
jgi:hypothetical protein